MFKIPIYLLYEFGKVLVKECKGRIKIEKGFENLQFEATKPINLIGEDANTMVE